MFVLTDIRNVVVYLASERPVPVRVNEEKYGELIAAIETTYSSAE